MGSTSISLNDVNLIAGGRDRGFSVDHVPEPLSIETMDEEATDYFSVSGSNLKADRCTVTCTRESGVVHSAFGTQLVSRGRIEWMIHIESGHSIRIGVCGSTASADQMFTDNAFGYGYDADGSLFFGGNEMEYNDGFKADDIVGVYLNMDEKTLKFSVNGVNHGLAFEDIKCDDKHGINGYVSLVVAV